MFPFREMIPPSEKKISASAAMLAQFRMPSIEVYLREFALIVVLRPGTSLPRTIRCLRSAVAAHS